jgi:hypothetical protein
MARYDKYGEVDDRIVEELDVGFVGFNDRLRPDQLSPGLLSISENGRMDINGQWQVRKAMDYLAAPFSSAVLQVHNASISKLRILDTSLPSVDSTASSLDASTGVITIVFSSAHGLVEADWDGFVLSLQGWNGNVVLNGNYNIDWVNSTTIRVTVTGLTSISTYGTVQGPTLDDTAASTIQYAIEYGDPNNDSESYVLCVGSVGAAVVNVQTGLATQISYPLGETAFGATAIQAFNKVYIFRDGSIAMEWDGDVTGSPSFTLVNSGDYDQPTQIVCSSGEYALVENRGVVHQAVGISVGDVISVVGDKTLSTDQTSGLTIGANFNVAEVFVGDTPTVISAASESLIAGGEFDGLYKITVTSAGHGLSVGYPIDIAGFSDTKIDGSRFVAEISGSDVVFYVPQNPSIALTGDETIALAHGFEFYIDANQTDSHVTEGNSLVATPVLTRVVSSGLGYIHMPLPPFAEYHQRRLVMPYRYDTSGSSASPTITNRNIRDEAIFSQILDGDTYDKIYGQFRFNAGTSDFLVGFHSFSEDKLVVFNRNSIHLVTDSLVLKDSVSTLITNEVGCVARRSIVQIGNNMMFLSDNGIYGVDFQDLYNLRGRDMPLSATIQATVSDINKTHASKAVGVYFNNRYYLAAPFGESNSNNKVIVYNFVNKNWESVDSVSNSEWEYTNLVVAGNGSNRGVYAINTNGGVHKLEASLGSEDSYVPAVGASTIEAPVYGAVQTRMYTLSSIDRKKWNNYEFHVESSSTQDSNADVTAITENIDSVTSLGTLQSINGNVPPAVNEDYSLRGRIGNKRAYGLQIKIETTTGRPKIRAIKVAGATTFRNSGEAE